MRELQERRILVVDDEANIVSAVQRELNSPPFVRYRYKVEGFTDPVRALDRAREQAFDAVISDFRMPAMDGLDFLKALSLIQPNCARLILSGQTDMAALIQMINETHIYRFIPKPWHDYYLKGSVAQALVYNAALAENNELASLALKHNIPLPPIDENAIDQLLIVDDDPGVLSSLTRTLSARTRNDDLFTTIRSEISHQHGPILREGSINVQATPSPRQAIEMAARTEFSCVIADFKMPEMNGIDLLQHFSDLQPDCQRILLSGQINENDLILAVDSAHIFAFIDKPWSDYELKACIALALLRRRILRENRLLAEMVRKSGHFADR